MSTTDDTHRQTEEVLKRVRPHELSAELKAKVVAAAREAWHKEPASIPWQIPLRRLATSAAAAVLIVSLANLYGDCASVHGPTRTPVARCAEPCDLDALMNVYTPLVRYMATAGRPAHPCASAMLDHLERVRETLREMERSGSCEEPAAVERRSRLPGVPSSLPS